MLQLALCLKQSSLEKDQAVPEASVQRNRSLLCPAMPLRPSPPHQAKQLVKAAEGPPVHWGCLGCDQDIDCRAQLISDRVYDLFQLLLWSCQNCNVRRITEGQLDFILPL